MFWRRASIQDGQALSSTWWRHCSETVFRDYFVTFRRSIAFLESEFFDVCLYANFQFSWWSTFGLPSEAFICQMPGHGLSRLAKGSPSESRLSMGAIWFGLFLVGCFWIWLRPRYKILEFFMVAPVLASTLTVCRRNRSDPSSLYRTLGALQVFKNT